MDALTREQYTSPWWAGHPDNSQGPSALVAARRRAQLVAAVVPQAVDEPVDDDR